MANKNINVLLKLQDQFSKPLKATTQETKLAQKQIKACSNVINGWANNANKKFKNVAAAAGKFVGIAATLGGVISVAGIKSFAQSAVEGFNAAHEAETKLAAVLQNVPSIIAQGAGAAAAAAKNLINLTDKMEETGVIAGDISVAGLQQLATFQLTEESLAKLAPGMADLVAQQKGLNATQSDAVSIGNLVGKAMTGQTGALSKAGIIMTDYQAKVMKTGTETERAAMMAEILEANVGGVNAALAQTDAGKIKVAENLLGRAQDEIGEKLMHLKASIFETAAKYIPDLQSAAINLIDKGMPKIEKGIAWIEEHSAKIHSGIGKVKQIVSVSFSVAKKMIGWVIDNGNVLIPILAGIVGGFAAFNIITSIVGIISTLTTVIQGVSAAGGILNAVMAANPIILVAAAIAALITIGVALYKNWDTIKAKAVELWDKVKAVFGGIKNAICNAFTAAKDTVKGVIDWIGEKLGWLGEKIEGIPVLGDIFKGVKAVGGAIVGAVTGNRKVDSNATGTSYFRGGATSINEGGRGEVVDLPSGTRIIPHDVAQKTIGGAPVVNVNLQVMGNVIGNQQFMEQCGDFVAKKVISALGTV